jgi:hypothetical protein
MQIMQNTHEQSKSISPYWLVCDTGGQVAEAMRADLQKSPELGVAMERVTTQAGVLQFA